MLGFELLKEFASRSDTSLRNVIKSLTDPLMRVCLSGDVEQALVSGGVLHDGGSLPLDGQNNRTFCFPELFKELGRTSTERRQRLNIVRNIEHGQNSKGTFLGATRIARGKNPNSD